MCGSLNEARLSTGRAANDQSYASRRPCGSAEDRPSRTREPRLRSEVRADQVDGEGPVADAQVLHAQSGDQRDGVAPDRRPEVVTDGGDGVVSLLVERDSLVGVRARVGDVRLLRAAPVEARDREKARRQDPGGVDPEPRLDDRLGVALAAALGAAVGGDFPDALPILGRLDGPYGPLQ